MTVRPVEQIVDDWRSYGVASFVYFVQHDDNGPVKIGKADDPFARLTELQCGNPYELHLRYVIPGDRFTEGRLHRRFQQARAGGEWFGNGAEEAILLYARGLSDRCFEVLRDTGFPPVTLMRDRPITALERQLILEDARQVRGGGMLPHAFIQRYPDADLGITWLGRC